MTKFSDSLLPRGCSVSLRVCALPGRGMLLLLCSRGGVLCTLHFASEMALFMTFCYISRSGDLSSARGRLHASSSSMSEGSSNID